MSLIIKKMIIIIPIVFFFIACENNFDVNSADGNCKVSYNSQGGTTVDPQTVPPGSLVDMPDAPDKSSSTFGGWFNEAECTNVWDFTNDKVVSDMTLYAKWISSTSGGTSYTVSFNSQGGTTVASQVVLKGGVVSEPVDPTRSGYIFDGWFKETGCFNAWNFSTDTVTSNKILYAKWIASSNPSYTVTFNSQAGTYIKSQTVTTGSKITAPADIPVKPGYVFGGWYRESGCTNAWNFASDTVTSNLTLYAKWTPGSYSGLSGFNLINSQAGRVEILDIVYNKQFSGDISYIVSTSDLNISNADEFDNSGMTIVNKTIIADSEIYNDYIELDGLTAGTKYYVYIKYGTEIKVLSRTTYVTVFGKESIYGTLYGLINGEVTTYNYKITFPSNYGATNEKWPFLISLKTSEYSRPNFSCVVFYIGVYSGSTTDTTEISNIKKVVNAFIENPENNIDLNRVYAYGFSAGANAAFGIANSDGSSAYNVKAILAGGASSWVSSWCTNLGNTDVWLLYGENDGYSNTTIINKLLSLTGTGEHTQTIIPDVSHDAEPILASPYTIMWLLNR